MTLGKLLSLAKFVSLHAQDTYYPPDRVVIFYKTHFMTHFYVSIHTRKFPQEHGSDTHLFTYSKNIEHLWHEALGIQL